MHHSLLDEVLKFIYFFVTERGTRAKGHVASQRLLLLSTFGKHIQSKYSTHKKTSEYNVENTNQQDRFIQLLHKYTFHAWKIIGMYFHITVQIETYVYSA